MSDFAYYETRYGFDWGPMRVSRAISDPKYGVVIMVVVGNKRLVIRSSPKGRVVEVREEEVRP